MWTSRKNPKVKLIINSFSPPSSPLFSLCLLHLLPPLFLLFPVMLLSWLRVLVYDWVTLLCLWSFFLLYIYLSAPSIWFYHLFVFFHSVSCCLLLFLPIFTSAPIPTPFSCCSPRLPASCYCNHLFSQPVAHFLIQPDVLLTDSVWFCNSHVTNSFCSSSKLLHPTLNVAFCLTQLWCVQHTSACKAALHT